MRMVVLCIVILGMAIPAVAQSEVPLQTVVTIKAGEASGSALLPVAAPKKGYVQIVDVIAVGLVGPNKTPITEGIATTLYPAIATPVANPVLRAVTTSNGPVEVRAAGQLLVNCERPSGVAGEVSVIVVVKVKTFD